MLTIGIPLTQGKIAYVDECDADLAEMQWCALKNKGRWEGAVRDNNRTVLHRLVLKRKLGRSIRPGHLTDHINRNVWDDRRCNLREVTNSQNQFNRKGDLESSSKYCGVSCCMHGRNRWQVAICVRGKLIHLGRFVDEEKAARAYDEAALLHHGKYANLNFGGAVVGVPPIEKVRLVERPVLGVSGYFGVYPSGHRWRARPNRVSLGTFDTPEQAAAAVAKFREGSS